MSVTSAIEAVRLDVAQTRDDLERRIRDVYLQPHVEEAELYEYGVVLDIWQFLAPAFIRGHSREPVDLYGPSDSPLTWAIRGRHKVTSGDLVVYLNAPGDVRVIHERVEALAESEVTALLRAEFEVIVTEYMAEGFDRERAQGMVGDPEMRHANSLWAQIVAFYRRAAAEGRYVASVIG